MIRILSDEQNDGGDVNDVYQQLSHSKTTRGRLL